MRLTATPHTDVFCRMAFILLGGCQLRPLVYKSSVPMERLHPPILRSEGKRFTWASKSLPPFSRVRMAAAASGGISRVCRVCKKQYDPAKNGPQACRHHPTSFTGRLLRVEPTDTSDLGFFYDCCGATTRDAPGCTLSAHQPYE